MAKKEQQQQQNIEQEISKLEQFFEKYQNYIFGVIIGIIVIIGGIFGYKKYIKEPKEREAERQMFYAEQYFAIDSFNVALNGKDQYPGFLQIIEDYKGTKAANLAHYYAGVCYANLGQWQQAIDYLKKFKTEDLYLNSTKYGLIADAYVQLQNYNEAIKFYKKATEEYANHLTSPIYLKKLGLLYEEQGDYKAALEAYNKIFNNYPASNEARTIEKYIERVKLKMQHK